MAVRKILQIGDLKLKAKNKTIKNFNSPQIKKVIKDLMDTLHKNDLIGIAAPQIGENYNLIVTHPRKTETRAGDQVDGIRIYINPQIIQFSDDLVIIYEGCGSVACGELFAPVKRPRQITIEAFDSKGIKFHFVCDGILGRVIQHEYDHLSGIEFTEKIFDYRKIISKDFYIKDIKNSPSQINASKITIKEFSEVPKS